MRGLRSLGVAVVGVVALGGTAAAVAVSQRNFSTHLSGANEVPAIETQGQGQAILRISKDETEIDFRLITANLTDITQAHIHCGAPSVNGPVVVFLFGLVAEGVTQNGVLSSGTITNANVIARPDSPECPGGVTDLDDVIAKLRSGDAYVNVHTLENPGGEIRGPVD